MVRAVLNDGLRNVEFRRDPVFGFDVPVTAPGVDSKLLNPREVWSDPEEYDRVYTGLAEKFKANFGQFRSLVRPEVAAAGP